MIAARKTKLKKYLKKNIDVYLKKIFFSPGNISPYPNAYAFLIKKIKKGIPKTYIAAQKNPLPETPTLFFESNLGKQYAGNPKYIYEYMQKKYPNYQYIWHYTGSEKIPGEVTIIRNRKCSDYYRSLAESWVAVNNSVFPIWFLRKETFYLQTWHGTPIKKLHWDVEVPKQLKTSPSFFCKSRGWNVLLSPNPYSTKIFASCFRYNGKIVETGYPRNSLFSNKTELEKVRSETRNKLGFNSSSNRLILYAPTWRDKKHLGNYMFKFDLLLDLKKLIENTPDNYIFLIRTHHMSADAELENEIAHYRHRIINVGHFDDITELIAASDTLITDYSSVMFDWACTGKPLIFFVPDLQEYKTILRGLYIDVDTLGAGPITINESQLVDALMRDTADSIFQYSEFREKYCPLNDGDATQRAVQIIQQAILEKEER